LAREGDKNTSYFHKQAKARNQFKVVNEIHVQDQIITDFEGIKEVATKDFETLYTETQITQIDSQAYLLSLVLNVIQEVANNNLVKEVTQQEIK
jgi:hypothetical protein